MKRYSAILLVATFGLSACGGAEAPEAEQAESEAVATEQEFDEQLSEEEANAALDALDAEEAAQE